MLYQLPNGNHVTLEEVSRVGAGYPGPDGKVHVFLAIDDKDRVANVSAGAFPDYASAAEARDKIAADVNEAQTALSTTEVRLVGALSASLNWLSSYPGGNAQRTYERAVDALKQAGYYPDIPAGSKAEAATGE